MTRQANNAYEEINVRFVQSAIISARPRLIQQGYGGGQPNINSEIVRSLRVPFPPRQEQDEIVCYLEQQTNALNLRMRKAELEINLIREYRTRLISDVVTGKIDVRHLVPPPGSEDLEETFEALEPMEEVIADVEMDDEEAVNESD